MHKLTLSVRTVSYNPHPLLETNELLNITGRDVYNRGRHQAIDFGPASKCCEHVAKLPLHMHLQPQAVVISKYPQAHPTTFDAVPGDRVSILGVEWMIVCQRYANPVLITVADVAKINEAAGTGEAWPYPLIRPVFMGL